MVLTCIFLAQNPSLPELLTDFLQGLRIRHLNRMQMHSVCHDRKRHRLTALHSLYKSINITPAQQLTQNCTVVAFLDHYLQP